VASKTCGEIEGAITCPNSDEFGAFSGLFDKDHTFWPWKLVFFFIISKLKT